MEARKGECNGAGGLPDRVCTANPRENRAIPRVPNTLLSIHIQSAMKAAVNEVSLESVGAMR